MQRSQYKGERSSSRVTNYPGGPGGPGDPGSQGYPGGQGGPGDNICHMAYMV